MVSPYLKNKGTAVRFCLWPLHFFVLLRNLRQNLRIKTDTSIKELNKAGLRELESTYGFIDKKT